jgi:sugar lactone lactonase YvrE
MNRNIIFVALSVTLVLNAAQAVAQTTAFTYQGRLTDNGNPADGDYDFEFRLFDALENGTQKGMTLPRAGVEVRNGTFSVQLEFVGCLDCFDGGARFLDISVRPAGGISYTQLGPRQPVTSTPYAVKSGIAANATTADGLSVTCVSCVTSSQIASVNGSAVTGTIPVASVPANSGNYIQNQNASAQAGNFNISGDGIVGGKVGIGTPLPQTSLHLNGNSGNFALTLTNSANTPGRRGYRLAFDNDRFTFQKANDDGIFSANQVSIEQATGNVGIGTTEPSAKLDVAGNVKFSGAIAGDGSGLTNLNGANIVSGTVTSMQLSPESVPNSTAFKLLGSLRWDLLKPQATFPVGNSPSGVAFDGANIWVTTSGTFTVTKLRASDGANLGSFPVGSGSNQVAFDGANIWVTNSGSSTVTKLRASDGACVGTCTFTVGQFPIGVAFDGANIWVANLVGGTVIKLRTSDGANLGTFTVGSGLTGVAFDGANIWVANQNSNNVTKLRASDGANLGTFTVGSLPQRVAFDGANIWVVNQGSNNVTKLRASDGACVGTCTFTVGTNPKGIAFDGANIWVVNSSSNGTVTKLRTSDGANLGTFTVGEFPIGVAFDGANIWVANNFSSNVTRLMPAFPQP